MHSSAIEMRSPAVSSMSISRPSGCSATSWARRTRSSVVLPIAETTTTTVVAGPAGAGDVVGDGPDAIGVGDRRAAELLDEQSTAVKATGGPRRRPDGVSERPPLRCPRLCPAPTSEHARRRTPGPRARRARPRQKREQRKSMAIRFGVARPSSSPSSSGSPRSSAATTTTTRPRPRRRRTTDDDDRAGRDARRLRPTSPPDNPNRPTFTQPPPMTIDPAKTYTATMSTTLRRHHDRARRQERAEDASNSFVFLAQQGFYDGLTFGTASPRTS